MAYKSFNHLTIRNQGNIVTQIHKLIKSYVDFFVMRERVYIKNLAKIDGSIYWISVTNNELLAMALLEPEHNFELEGVSFKTLGHIIARKPGVIDRVIRHIWEDNKNDNIIAFSKPRLAHAILDSNEKIVEFNALDLATRWPSMGNRITSYFNIRNEKTMQAMLRKDQHLYIKFTIDTIEKFKKTNLDLYNFIQENIK